MPLVQGGRPLLSIGRRATVTDMTSTQATTIATWAAAIAAMLQARGVDPAPAFEAAGLDLALTFEPEARLPITGMSRLWQEARRLTRDEAVGLEVAAHVTPAALHRLGDALLASDSLLDAAYRIERWGRLVSDAGRTEVVEHSDSVDLVVREAEGVGLADEALDATASTLVQFSRMLTGSWQSTPIQVSLRRPRPARPERFRRFFRCPVLFARTEVVIRMDRSLAEQPLPAANRERALAHEAVIEECLARMDDGDLLHQVRCEMIRRLALEEPLIEDVAPGLGLSVRTLQRRLAQRGTHYAALLDDARRQLAEAYLSRWSGSLADIAGRLGFADAANFSRAFRRWKGMTPGQWRRLHGPGV